MTENWIIPCNVKFFNVVEYLETHQEIVWKRRPMIHKNDIVYIYVGAPYSEIKFKGHVVNEDVGSEILAENAYAIQSNSSHGKVKYVQIRIDYKYEDGALKWDVLKQNGLGQVQIQARADRKLKLYLDTVNEQLELEEL